TETPGVAKLRRPASARVLWLLVGVAVIVILSILSIAFGVRAVSLGDIFAAFSGHDDTVEQATIIKRMPRTVLAIFVGAALALSGAAMQAVTRNPIADPGILGVTSGASLAVVIGIAFFGVASAYGYMVLAIVGAAVTAV